MGIYEDELKRLRHEQDRLSRALSRRFASAWAETADHIERGAVDVEAGNEEIHELVVRREIERIVAEGEAEIGEFLAAALEAEKLQSFSDALPAVPGSEDISMPMSDVWRWRGRLGQDAASLGYKADAVAVSGAGDLAIQKLLMLTQAADRLMAQHHSG